MVGRVGMDIESYELMSGDRHGGVLSWGIEYAG